MLPAALRARSIAAACLALSACSETVDPPVETGAVEVTISTSGGAPDPDGYFVRIGKSENPIATEGSVTVAELPTGEASLAVTGLAPNCSLPPGLPATVSVSASDTVAVQLVVSCPSDVGGLQVTVTIGGIELDTDGFSIRIGDDVARTVTPGVPLDVPELPVGTLPVTFEGLAPTCRAEALEPRLTVYADRVIPVRVGVQCGWMLATVLGSTTYDLHRIAVNGTVQRVGGGSGYEWAASWSPDQAEAVFVELGSFDLMFARPDEQDPRIVATPEWEWNPTWSRTANLIAFERRDLARIHVMHPDGTGVHELTSVPCCQQDPVFSPDGSRIAFRGYADGANGIWVINVDGTGLERLTVDPGFVVEPAWSPDGSEIAFASSVSGVFQIYVINADGSDLRQLTFDGPGFDSPEWSPSGTHIAISWIGPEPADVTQRRLYIMRSDGSELREVANGAGGRAHGWMR